MRPVVARSERPRTLRRAARHRADAAPPAAVASRSPGGRHAMGGQQFAHRLGCTSIRPASTACSTPTPTRGLLHDRGRRRLARTSSPPRTRWTAPRRRLGHPPEADRGRRGHARRLDLRQRPRPRPADAAARRRHRGPDARRCHAASCVTAAARRTPSCSRWSIGGYGLFGSSIPRRCGSRRGSASRRIVDIIDLDDAMNAVLPPRGGKAACSATSSSSSMRPTTAFCAEACSPATSRRPMTRPTEPTRTSSPDAWLKLIKLAHDDKTRRFQALRAALPRHRRQPLLVRHHQLCTYMPTYAEFLAEAHASPRRAGGQGNAGHRRALRPARHADRLHGPRARHSARSRHRGHLRHDPRDPPRHGLVPAVGEGRLRLRHLQHPDPAYRAGLQRTADTFRALIDASAALGGSFFLTYHRYASAAQVAACYPRFAQFLRRRSATTPRSALRATGTCTTGTHSRASAGCVPWPAGSRATTARRTRAAPASWRPLLREGEVDLRLLHVDPRDDDPHPSGKLEREPLRSPTSAWRAASKWK